MDELVCKQIAAQLLTFKDALVSNLDAWISVEMVKFLQQRLIGQQLSTVYEGTLYFKWGEGRSFLPCSRKPPFHAIIQVSYDCSSELSLTWCLGMRNWSKFC